MVAKKREYDFTGDKLGILLRVVGGLAVLVGVASVVCAVLFAVMEFGMGTPTRLLTLAGIVVVGSEGVDAIVLGALLFAALSKLALAGFARALTLNLIELSALLLLMGLANAGGTLCLVFGAIGVAMAVVILSVIAKGRIDQGRAG